MVSGDVFIPCDDSIQNPHIHIVISDSDVDPNNLLIISVTTLKVGREQSCILEPIDHPFIQHSSIINYGEAKIVSADDLSWNIKLNKIEQLKPIDANVLNRIRKGAENSIFLPEGCRKFLILQELIVDKA